MFRHVFRRFVLTRGVDIDFFGQLPSSSRYQWRNVVLPSGHNRTWSTSSIVCKDKSNSSDQTQKSPSPPKIYTRRGDKGTSTLLSTGAHRVSKDALIFDVLGTIDELSSSIGIVISHCSFPTISKQLENIQCALFEIGSCLAAENRSLHFTFNNTELVKHLEENIDQMTAELPQLRNFILPGGSSKTASHVHFSRAVCRRCERLLTKWVNSQTEEHQQEHLMGIFMNRLSDYLFTLGRYVAHKEGRTEVIYHKSA